MKWRQRVWPHESAEPGLLGYFFLCLPPEVAPEGDAPTRSQHAKDICIVARSSQKNENTRVFRGSRSGPQGSGGFRKPAGRVGSGQEVFEIPRFRSGRDSIFFLILRVGPGRPDPRSDPRQVIRHMEKKTGKCCPVNRRFLGH